MRRRSYSIIIRRLKLMFKAAQREHNMSGYSLREWGFEIENAAIPTFIKYLGKLTGPQRQALMRVGRAVASRGDTLYTSLSCLNGFPFGGGSPPANQAYLKSSIGYALGDLRLLRTTAEVETGRSDRIEQEAVRVAKRVESELRSYRNRVYTTIDFGSPTPEIQVHHPVLGHLKTFSISDARRLLDGKK